MSGWDAILKTFHVCHVSEDDAVGGIGTAQIQLLLVGNGRVGVGQWMTGQEWQSKKING